MSRRSMSRIFTFVLAMLVAGPAIAAKSPTNQSQTKLKSKRPIDGFSYKDDRQIFGLSFAGAIGSIDNQSLVIRGTGTATSPSSAVGGINVMDNQPVHAFSLGFDYQPIYDLGVAGIGVVGEVYPAGKRKEGAQPNQLKAAWTYMGKLFYQFRYWRNQIVVPTIGYYAGVYNYRFDDGVSGRFYAHGPGVGGMLNLSALDSPTAESTFHSTGISRFYFTFEARRLMGDDITVDLLGWKYMFGIRAEI